MRTIADALAARVLLSDGAIWPQLKEGDFSRHRDFLGAEGCVEALNLTRPKAVSAAHLSFLSAGADLVRTNSDCASPLTLAARGLAEDAFYINYAAAQAAVQAVDSIAGDGRRRFVLGVIRDLEWDAPDDEVVDASAVQAEGLIAGGADGLALELKAGSGRAHLFLAAARLARGTLGTSTPIFLFARRSNRNFRAQNLIKADGLIHHEILASEDAAVLSHLIKNEGLNLIGAGDRPEATRKMDETLRRQAEDGLRPLCLRIDADAEEDISPASSCLNPSLLQAG